MSDNVLITVENLTKSFGDLLVLNDISFKVFDGEFLCIVGPTGCGKTTFLNTLVNLYPATKGEILLKGKPVDLRKNSIAYIFQDNSTMPWLTVEENVRFGLDIKGINKNEATERVNRYLKMVGLEEYKNYYPRQLSASMIQRVSIARAFVTEPEILLMDEPYGQLDIELRMTLEDELLKIQKETGTTVIFITHNIEEAVYLGDRIMILTNKPTSVREVVDVHIPHPRNIADKKFVEYRNKVTELIKWW
ncbi:ABC transporter ATP-binding protein [Anaerococcus murdochii]|uniref:ABC transporter ATP-binding protein n=1 Tax=Anaerococcus murdochii TaxID=411577 RepID=A0ABS7SZJ3_9FIRM|nr:ABC transporter ATP-binding protein [Anaerococcus murdochii]MBZ2386949.1 ABC transporter ATP-binding protein [Anaerococcus murdochii]